MSNSVVKVTDTSLSDSLLLLVGVDGTVTPSKEVVEAYLTSRTDATNLQVMHINTSDNQGIEVDVDTMLYIPDSENKSTKENSFDEIAYHLYNIQLDHDYTSHCEPPEEVDELAKTLSLLDGSEGQVSYVSKQLETKNDDSVKEIDYPLLTSPKLKVKVNTSVKTSPKQQQKKKVKCLQEKSNTGTKNDKDVEHIDTVLESDSKPKTDKKIPKADTKSQESFVKPIKAVKSVDEVDSRVDFKIEKPLHGTPELKSVDKKQLKKDRKVTKAVPDDFALFSTPDIIRRVGGKEALTTNSPVSPVLDLPGLDSKPAKIEARSKSASDSLQSPSKQNRLSLDDKVVDKQVGKVDNKCKEKKYITEIKTKKLESVFKKNSDVLLKTDDESVSSVGETFSHHAGSVSLNYESKSYVPNIPINTQNLSCNEQNITLDSNSLDLDPTLLDNINNDLISEDILYQVAQSLVSNTELQNAIDKSLNEEDLALEHAVQGVVEQRQDIQERSGQVEHVTSSANQKGTQIVRPDGRIVVIPPIERPTTRSRNKKQEDKSSRLVRKPLDEEHVSGNELDSSGEEEESEDDPNKLWCICNQPHNNRFMICCDTCEEWYHGKCVNITKAMGQQMEAEGKEWICLFCKDPNLKRPQAAAKRIRKASRNSRQSSDSTGSVKIVENKPSCVPCVVCQKPSRSNSIFCSEACILVHAQGVERVVVFERSTGNMLTGNKAPSAANLEQWLKDHPGYEVVRSAGKIVTTKQPHNISPSKLKIVKNVSTSQNKQVTVSGDVKIVPKTQNFSVKSPPKGNIGGLKILNKQISTTQQKEKSNVISTFKESDVSSPKSKTLQSSTKPGVSPGSKEKSVTTKLQKVRSNEQVSSNSTQPKQENIRENVQKTIFEQLTNRLRMADDFKLSEDELKNISNEIESQLYKCFGDTGQKYRNKYRSLIFNIKDIKNQTLWRRICEKSINPYQLVRLSPDDLASQELALWREREAKHQLDMIKKSELELLQCNRQYVLKTHKGEQILEDNRPTDHIDSTEVITSLTDASSGEKSEKKRDYSKDSERKSSKHSHKDKERKPNRDKTESKSSHRSHRSTSGDRVRDRSRKRSRSRDRNLKHNDKRRSRSRSRGRDRYRRSSHKSSKHKRDSHRGSSTDKLDKKSKEILEQLVDSKIVPPLEDRLWKHVPQEDILPAPLAESDSDHEPTSTVTIPTPPHSNDLDDFIINQPMLENKGEKSVGKEQIELNKTSPSLKLDSEEIWRGIINMIDVAQISITAHEVSGDCNGLAAELPPNLDIVGRISPDTVWDYIGKMKCSNSKIISIVRLNAINVEEKMPYLALYSYLSSRNRLGVVKSTNKAVKDFYILPLASQKPIPQALLPLNGPGFEEARPALLLGIIVRDKRKRPFFDSVTSLATTNVKKTKTEPPVVVPARSYTPPPIKDNRRNLPLPPTVTEHDGDEPYSPEDSDPDSAVPATPPNNISVNFLESETRTHTFQPFVNKFDDIPGLDNTALPSSTQEIQRQMEKLNKEIEMQKSEINSISQNIATASTGIGSSALANIALPSNLQQILDSIKTIGSTPSVECVENKPQAPSSSQENSELTIPLILPTTFSRHSSNSTPDIIPENTIPLNLPSKKKSSTESDKTNSVLSSLSEEDLIRKAEEMLEETQNIAQEQVDLTVGCTSSRSENSVISTPK